MTHPSVKHALLCARADRVLAGACDPTVCPTHGVQDRAAARGASRGVSPRGHRRGVPEPEAGCQGNGAVAEAVAEAVAATVAVTVAVPATVTVLMTATVAVAVAVAVALTVP